MTYNSFFLIAQAKEMIGWNIHPSFGCTFFTNKLKEIYCIQLVHKATLTHYVHFLLPPKFNNYFSLNKQVHSYATRHANDFHLPSCRTNLRKFSVSFQGPTSYNTIENDIKESNSLHLFKTKLKKKLYMNY